MAMPVVPVRNLKGEIVGEITLSDRVFARPLNEALVWEAVRWFLAKQRAGTASTKTRGEVSGSGRKPWRQKGTGRARVGSIRTPLWRHGGTVHGPKPRDYSYTVPKKVRRAALAVVLSERLREGNLLVFDEFALPDHKTKHLAQVLAALGLGEKKTLLVDSSENRNLQLASRNLPRVGLTSGHGLNIYEALYYETIAFSQAAIREVEAILSRS
jgi:large subunit ribosomal protein L4